MKVGMCMWGKHLNTPSMRRIFRCKYEGVAAGAEVVFLPPEYGMVAAADRDRLAEEFVRECDLIVGLLDLPILAARQRTGSGVPFLYFTHGSVSWGAWVTAAHMEFLTARDVMVVNCSSEVEIAGSLFDNATVRVAPFAYDEKVFFPLGDEERRAARERLRFRESDRILLYSGRLTPEKNVHRLLGIFETVSERVPDAHLVLVGGVGQANLDFFGVSSVYFQNTVSRLISRMRRPERVHVVRAADDERLRELYNVADVKVNLTLNPDENFGMAQVEAMACGTPVVGTAWGGLKDTIVDGVSGYRVSTVATATGVKASWWEAVNRVVSLLEDRGELRRLRAECIRTAARYTQAGFEAVLGDIMAEAFCGRGRPAEPLRATAFARELWSECDPRLPGPPFRRGGRSEALHRELVAPFTAPSPAHAPADEALAPDQVLSLATPAQVDGEGRVLLDDVFYPFGVEVPARHRDAVHAVVERMREQPALRVEELSGAVPLPGLPEALAWMLDAGVLLRTRPMPEWIDPGTVSPRIAEAVFTTREVDRAATDLIVYTP